MASVATAERPRAGAAPNQLALPPVRIHDNPYWTDAESRLSIIIPFRRQDPLSLLRAVASAPEAPSCEIILYDDGAGDRDRTAQLCAVADHAPSAVRIVTAAIAIGKARARNILAGHCRADWILMLEADTLPADAKFLGRYLDLLDNSPVPGLIIGGFSPAPPPKPPRYALHHHHSSQGECLPAAQRDRRPVRHLHVGNALFHREIFSACRFDELFRGRGWEGVDWGLRVARAYPISHIDNPLIRTSFDNDFELLNRYRKSAPNFARLVAWHPHALGKSPLVRAALFARRLPFRDSFTQTARRIAVADSLPLRLRARAFKAWRALIYASAL